MLFLGPWSLGVPIKDLGGAGTLPPPPPPVGRFILQRAVIRHLKSLLKGFSSRLQSALNRKVGHFVLVVISPYFVRLSWIWTNLKKQFSFSDCWQQFVSFVLFWKTVVFSPMV